MFLSVFLRAASKGVFENNMSSNAVSHIHILITGGCGFIGSNFVRYLYEKYPSYQIVNLDALTYAGNVENLSDIEAREQGVLFENRRYQFMKGDISDVMLVESLFKKYPFQNIFHFAAETHVDRSFFNVSDFLRTNIQGTWALLEAARRHRTPRFVHISTDEVYGSVESGFSSEDAPLRPSNAYASSKAGADLLVQSYMKSFDSPALIIRGSNNFGPYQYPEKLIPLAVTNLIEQKHIPVHGTGLHTRSWLHVHDFCRAIDLIAHRASAPAIYNVAGEPKTNIEILHAIADILGEDIAKYARHINDRPGADLRYAPDAGALERDLSWRRVHSIESSLRDVIQWYVDRKNWWQKIKAQKEFSDHYEKQSRGLWY